MSSFRSALAAILLLCAAGLITPQNAASDATKPPREIRLGFDGPSGSRVIPQPWRLRVRQGTAGVSLMSEAGETVLHLECSGSSFGVERPLAIPLATHPIVSWSWRALQLP